MAARRLREPTGVRPRVRRSLRSALGVKTLSGPREESGGACVVAAAAAVVAATSSQAGAEVENERTERPRSAREVDAIVCRTGKWTGMYCRTIRKPRPSPKSTPSHTFSCQETPARKAPPHLIPPIHTHTQWPHEEQSLLAPAGEVLLPYVCLIPYL
jgi:hypothetical protein